MKKLHLLVAASALTFFLFAGNSAFAQKLKTDDIPDDVQQSFEFEHPGGKISQWTLNDNCFVATFKEDGSIGKCFIANDGTWVKTYYDIPKNSLPSNVMAYIKENYPIYIVSVARLQELPKEKLHYYVEVKEDGVGKEPSILTFSNNGTLMERKDPANFVAYVAPTPVQKPVKTEEEKAQEKAEKEAKAAAKAKAKQAAAQAAAPKELNPSSIPPIVTKSLSKKVQRPEELKWYKEGNVYIAKCIAKMKPTEVYINDQGVWEKTYTQMDEEQVTGAMAKYINNTYKGWKFVEAKKETRADKMDKTYVQFYEKQNKKSKLVTTIIFDKTGKLIKTIDPEIALGGGDDRFGKEENLDKMYKNIDLGDAEEDQATTILSPSDLPYQLQSYVSKNYPEYVYKECSSTQDEDLGSIYIIILKPDGISSKTETLYFNYNGKFIKRVNANGEDADIAEAEERAAAAEAAAERAAEEAELAAEAAAEAAENGETPEAADANIPDPVKASFKSKHANTTAEWSRDDDGNYIAKYQGVRYPEFCYIKPDGTLLETHTTLSPSNVTVTIQTYLKENYKGSKVLEYYSVKATDRKNYYKVVIRPKKSTLTETLWFTTSGKITYHW